MLLGLINVRSTSGSARKYSQLAASVSRKAGWGAMLSALRPTWDLSLTGQVSTHRVQPVQSSGATCTVYFIPGNSLNLESMDLNVAGASLSRSPAYTLWRMTACGQTKTHLPHWMHRSGSQTGMSSEMFRFSQRVVPVGKVPSTGIPETGISSPSKTIILPSTSCTNCGA